MREARLTFSFCFSKLAEARTRAATAKRTPAFPRVGGLCVYLAESIFCPLHPEAYGDFMQILLVANETEGSDFFTFVLLLAIHPFLAGHVYGAYVPFQTGGMGLRTQRWLSQGPQLLRSSVRMQADRQTRIP